MLHAEEMSQASGDEEMSQARRKEMSQSHREEMPTSRREEMSTSRREEMSASHREEMLTSHREEDVDVKPKLNLRIVHEGEEITVRVKANMPFRKIFDAATLRFKKAPDTLRFTYEGARIQPKDTPAGLGMEDDDVVDANLQQLGGDSVSVPT